MEIDIISLIIFFIVAVAGSITVPYIVLRYKGKPQQPYITDGIENDCNKKIVELKKIIDELTSKQTELIGRLEKEEYTRHLLVRQLTREIELRVILEQRVHQLERVFPIEENKLELPSSNIESAKFSVLGIWPTINVSGEPLKIAEEMDAIYNAGFEYTKLIGNVTRTKIILELTHSKQYDIIHIGSHADSHGIQLSDNDIVKPGWWANIAEITRAKLIMIMACESLEVADVMVASGAENAIAFRYDIPDIQVILFVKSFYQFLKLGKPLQQAFDLARLSLQNGFAQEVVLRQRNEGSNILWHG